MLNLSWAILVLQFFACLPGAQATPVTRIADVANDYLWKRQGIPAPADLRTEAHITTTETVGYPHGKGFSDKFAIGTTHRRMAAIGLACFENQHVTGMTTAWQNNRAAKPVIEVNSIQGKSRIGEPFKSLDLLPGEYIVTVNLATWRAKTKQGGRTVRHTRVGWIKFTTNKGNLLECGAKSSSDPTFTWGDGKAALLYLSGSSGDAIDALQGHFIPAADY